MAHGLAGPRVGLRLRHFRPLLHGGPAGGRGVDDAPGARESPLLQVGDFDELAGGADAPGLVVAEHGAELQARHDVLLSDLGMPWEDGYVLIAKVRALPRERGGRIPAAALTAYVRAEDRVRVLGSGFQLHVPKPLEPNELVAVVANLAGRLPE